MERVKRFKPEIRLLNAPDVHSIKDLIELGNSTSYYKNIDMIMLWRITPYLVELNKMIGMNSLKETLFYQVIYYLQGMHTRNLDGEYLHTVIYGAPGSGKTTVAKIIGKIYQAMGVLSEDAVFKVAYRDDFIAGYLGQTANKTKKLLKSCLGGILFIDEVYSLAPRKMDKDSFSKEAIDTINSFLSEHKNDLCCIIAGYEDEIKNCFFSMNQGLERRFPWVHTIEEYDSNDLYQIFMKMLTDISWETDIDENELIYIFERNKIYFKHTGGDIETFLSKCKMIHSKRVFSLGKQYKFILSREDILAAMEFTIKNNERVDDGPPMGMYT